MRPRSPTRRHAPAQARRTKPPPASARRSTAATAIHTTAADLRAAGTPEGDINPGNYGSYEVILDRGRFKMGPPKHPTAVGTCTVVGNTITLTVSHGAGGRGSSRPGERFDFRWSRYRDQLTLAPVKGKSSPQPLLAKPWRRIGSAP